MSFITFIAFQRFLFATDVIPHFGHKEVETWDQVWNFLKFWVLTADSLFDLFFWKESFPQLGIVISPTFGRSWFFFHVLHRKLKKCHHRYRHRHSNPAQKFFVDLNLYILKISWYISQVFWITKFVRGNWEQPCPFQSLIQNYWKWKMNFSSQI